ncbi:ThuA domain-containing protein [Spirosoma fluminis]
MKQFMLPTRPLLLAGVLAVSTLGTTWAQTPAKRAVAAKSATTQSAATKGEPTALNRVLVFSKTKGFRHASIPVGRRAIMKLGQENGFAVDTTEDASKFTEDNLKRYGAVIWLSTTGNVLDDAQQAAFERYIQAGGGFVGVHAAADTEYDWPWYNQLVGAYFLHHPKQQNVDIKVLDKSHPSTQMLPDVWKRFDELYSYKSIVKDIKVLAKLDESTYEGGKNGDNHPFIWYREFDGGKSFYTGGGHTDESYSEPLFMQHLLGGIKSVMAKDLKYSQAKTQAFPEENRFMKNVLMEKLDEPTELVVLDNGKVLFTERKGAVKMYDTNTKTSKVVANVPVHFDREYGLMGLNVDPKFNENKWVYLYYSAVKPDSNNRLVRVKWDDAKNELLLNTEQLLLTVTENRTYDKDDCCHTGGSIAWDKQGNLYLSTGDNTNPFFSKGFSPSDDRKERKKFNALLSASNTNNLRGKILRIKPRTDSGYDIPDGNLFPKGTPNARPEIYVMGNRNPYRISVDQRTGFLYWGEVGPDAGENSDKYGPRGHDEMNQARKAGYFGWPLFVADNKPYRQFNFADSTSGPYNDPAKPINYSAHNTGLKELPPAQKAFIYYPYADSPEFGEIVGKGGRNAMGGPVYYYDDYADSPVKFPRHYDGKFFAYEWMRGWINPVTMNENGDFVKMEKFMPNTKFDHPMDMQFAKDGSLWMLEYGTNWFAQNDDARLVHITYNAGNRQPIAAASANKVVGAAPLTVAFSSKGTMDYDGDAIKYEWTFGKGMPKSTQANPTITFSKPGIYQPTLKVTDASGNVSTKTMEIKVGNDAPKVEVAIKGNKTFYFDNKPIDYEVKVADKEDGTLAAGKISPEDVTVTVNYLEGFDKAMLAQGHQINTGFATGRRLIELSDCKACHSIDKKSVGPAYVAVAERYAKERRASIVNQLAKKVIAGGGGNWGEQAMSAHPQLKEDEAKEMVSYILSLGDKKKIDKQPLKGTYVAKPKEKDGSYIFTASYTDKGSSVIGPQTGSNTIALRSSTVKAVTADVKQDIYQADIPKLGAAAIGLKSGSYLAFNDLDLTGIQSIAANAFSADDRTAGGKLEARLDSPTGTLLGEADVKQGSSGLVTIPFRQSASGMHKVYFVFVNPGAGQKPLFAVDKLQFMAQGASASSGSSTGQGK